MTIYVCFNYNTDIVKLKDFIKNNSEEDIREFVASIFEILKKSNINNTETVTLKKIVTCINLVRELPATSKTKDKLFKLFNILLGLYMPNNLKKEKKKEVKKKETSKKQK